MSQRDRKNAYYCPVCKDYIVTVDVDEGVTPMFLACRVLGDPTDPANTCRGTMSSMGYPAEPWPEGAPVAEPTWEWFKPTDLLALSPEMRDYVERGGLLIRQITSVAA